MTVARGLPQLIEHRLREGLLELRRKRVNFVLLHPILPITFVLPIKLIRSGGAPKGPRVSCRYINHL